MKRLILRPGMYTGEIRLTEEEKEEISPKPKIKFPADLLIELKEVEIRREKDEVYEKKMREKEWYDRFDERERRSKDEIPLQLALNVIIWIKLFIRTNEAKSFFRVCNNKICLLRTKYFNRQPGLLRDNQSSCIYLVRYRDGSVGIKCIEKYKSNPEFESLCRSLDCGLDSLPNEIAKSLHPYMLKELADAFTNGRVFDFIKGSIVK